ncbi:MAG TPA: hypothetical protein PLL66_09525 [Bacteroidales bacterium]|nr:hypothetical protein [Bacteroidales bacterium]
MNKEQIADLKIKILKGIDDAYIKLLETKIKEDGELVVSKDGKVHLIKAKELFEKK